MVHDLDGSDLMTARWASDAERVATTEIVDALAAVGITAGIWHTGGGCMALGVQVNRPSAPEGYDAEHVLITNGDAGLPDGDGIFVGHYDEADREEGEMLIERERGPYDVAEVVCAVARVVAAAKTDGE
jgi:hypothetical protein